MKVHDFEAAERKFFAARLALIDRTVAELNGAVALYCETHDLTGPWQLAPDGSPLFLN